MSVRCTRSNLMWRGMWTSFLIQHGWPYDAPSLVHLYFVAATCCRKCTHAATTLLSLILSPRLVARIQTSLNSCDWSRGQNFAAATMIFIKLTVSHKANCCGDFSPRRVAAGQHSLTSVERQFNLRSDFVNVWCHARFVGYVYLWLLLLRSYTLICLMIWCLFRGLVLLFLSSLDWFKHEDVTVSV